FVAVITALETMAPDPSVAMPEIRLVVPCARPAIEAINSTVTHRIRFIKITPTTSHGVNRQMAVEKYGVRLTTPDGETTAFFQGRVDSTHRRRIGKAAERHARPMQSLAGEGPRPFPGLLVKISD